MRFDREAAERAITDGIAKPLGIGLVEAAWGIRQVLDNRMADLLRQVTIERGHDPREFTMFANGGSGPSHGWVLARELGLREFVVPATATVQSAFGTGTSDIKVTTERPVYLRLGPDGVPSEKQLRLLTGALCESTREAVCPPLGNSSAAEPILLQTVAIRYLGQSHHLHVQLAEELLERESFHACIERFEADYEALFGRGAGFRAAGFEVIAVRALATRTLTEEIPSPSGGPIHHRGTRPVWFDDPAKPLAADIYAVEFPAAGQQVNGPCLVKYPGQTAVLPPGSTGETDELGNLIVRLI